MRRSWPDACPAGATRVRPHRWTGRSPEPHRSSGRSARHRAAAHGAQLRRPGRADDRGATPAPSRSTVAGTCSTSQAIRWTWTVCSAVVRRARWRSDSEPARPWPHSQVVSPSGISRIEVYPPGVGRLLARCHEAGIENVRVAMADALDVLERWLAPSSVEEVLVWFPDPWPKKRHHKRRLVQPEFATLVHRALRPGGRLHLATDWEPYAEHMLEVLGACSGFSNCAAPERFIPRPARRRETRFESRGRRRGLRVLDLAWRTVASDGDTAWHCCHTPCPSPRPPD